MFAPKMSLKISVLRRFSVVIEKECDTIDFSADQSQLGKPYVNLLFTLLSNAAFVCYALFTPMQPCLSAHATPQTFWY